MRKISNILLNCWFPRVCSACHRSLSGKEEGVCFYCQQYLHKTNHFERKNNMLFLQLGYRMNLHSVQSLYFFQPKSIEQRAIHELKYKKNMQVGHFFGREMGRRILLTRWLKDVDFIVPIPIHKNKESERGYNQAQVLCEGISEETNLPILKILKKQTAGKGATKGNRMDRMNSRKIEFQIGTPVPSSAQHILIVDDVITTGATLESAFHILRNQFHGKISVVSIAHTF
jgi:competence protein ComFC